MLWRTKSFPLIHTKAILSIHITPIGDAVGCSSPTAQTAIVDSCSTLCTLQTDIFLCLDDKYVEFQGIVGYLVTTLEYSSLRAFTLQSFDANIQPLQISVLLVWPSWDR